MQPVDFWIEFGSTYTYLSVARIGKFAAAQGVEVRWQPFFLMPIMAELGMTEGPFLPFPSKTRYMWRDIERRALRHDALRSQTERAKSLGIFGAPSFTVDGELFRGDDRLEEAVEWARTH